GECPPPKPTPTVAPPAALPKSARARLHLRAALRRRKLRLRHLLRGRRAHPGAGETVRRACASPEDRRAADPWHARLRPLAVAGPGVGLWSHSPRRVLPRAHTAPHPRGTL